MKATMIINLAIRLFIIPFLVFSLAISPHQAQAQEGDSPEPSEKFSREELAQMLAPIALYPDALLSQVLMASTYPIEVIEADRWVRRNPELTGETLDDAILGRVWDPSIKALCHFPSILALMSERIAETTNIGNAFLIQEDEVMDMVQELRTKAYAQGNLKTTTEQKVIVQKETIIVEPADPRVIFVPYYDPNYIYGPWWYPAYPPYYWGPTRVSNGIGISYWPAFYLGFAFGTWSYFDWHYHHIYINVHNRPRYVRHDRWLPKSGRWNHSPRHRRGVAYRDKFTARRYGQYPSRTRNFRPSTRGFPERIDRNRRVNGRIGIDRNTQEDGRLETDRALLEQQRIDRNKLERARVQPAKRERQRDTRDRLPQQQAVQEILQPEQIDRNKLERARVQPARRKRQRDTHDRLPQQQAVQEVLQPEQIDRQQQQRSRDNIFNQVEDGRVENQSSRRGKYSRQGSYNDPKSRNHSDSGGDSREKITTETVTDDNQESQAMILPIQRGALMMARNVYAYRLLRLFPSALAILITVFGLTASQVIAGGATAHKFFPSQQHAVEALIAAVQNDNVEELLEILGPGSEDLVFSGDKVADQNGRARFLKAYYNKNSLVQEEEDRTVLLVGNKEYPFPIPIVRLGDAWLFDTQAGIEEILNRRIGRNELHTIEVMQAYTDAQREYVSTSRNGDSPEFAQRFASSEGKKDGLYWHTEEGEAESPFGPMIARATEEGYGGGLDRQPPEPFHGYYFKILKGQGEHANGGAYNYVSEEKMILGFALIAYPAKYGASGIMTFIINQEGVIYEKDMGPATAKKAPLLANFDPDDTWHMYEVPAEQ